MKRTGRVKQTILLLFCSIWFLFVLSGCDENELPIAEAGNNLDVNLGDYIELNGGSSYDPDGVIKDYQWVITIKPEGSNATLDSSKTIITSFSPDIPGVYVIELIVFDGQNSSSRDHIFITVSSGVAGFAPAPFPVPHPPPPPPPPFPPAPPMPTEPHPMPPIHGPDPITPVVSPGIPPISLPPSIPYFGLVDKEIIIPNSLEDQEVMNAEYQITSQVFGSNPQLEIGENGNLIFVADVLGSYIITQEVMTSDTVAGAFNYYVQIIENHISAGQDIVTLIGVENPLGVGFFTHIPPSQPNEQWQIISKPEGSQAEIEVVMDGRVRTVFIADVLGEYELQVSATLDDGTVAEDTIVVTAVENIGSELDHAGFFNNCINCHNGLHATGKSPTHVPTTDNCDRCHQITSFVPVITVDHNEVMGSCSKCHNNILAIGKSPSHLATNDSCEACHSTVAFIPVITFDHSAILEGFACEVCHNNIVAMGKPANHEASSDACGDCHNTIFWSENPVTDPLPALTENFEFSVKASAGSYRTGELVNIKAVLTNVSDKDVQVYSLFGQPSPIVIEIDGPPYIIDRMVLSNPNDSPSANATGGAIIVAPGESISRDVIWDQKGLSSGLVKGGLFGIQAYVLVLDEENKRREKLAASTGVVIDMLSDHITEEKAILAALQEPSVKVWYESIGSDITCRIDGQASIVLDYEVTPIATLAPVDDTYISCHAELIKRTGLEWDVFFHSAAGLEEFVSQVSIDALTGDIKP